VVGRTVTLELKPEEIPTLASGRQAGTLSLALRSMADANMVENTASTSNRGDRVNVIRYGVPSDKGVH
jgi:pilus assembly protein CpaB